LTIGILKIIIHKDFPDSHPHINAALETYTLEEIKGAIDNYAYIYSNQDKFFWTYKWQLDKFLLRGLDRFLPINFKEQDYLKRVYKSKAELEERTGFANFK